jgi:hypothetical protein
MIFETAADKSLAVGKERGGERIASMACEPSPVEGEGQRDRTIDETTFRKAIGGHAVTAGFLAASRQALISWVAVSRVTISQRRQPELWCQYSSYGPRGFSRRKT